MMKKQFKKICAVALICCIVFCEAISSVSATTNQEIPMSVELDFSEHSVALEYSDYLSKNNVTPSGKGYTFTAREVNLTGESAAEMYPEALFLGGGTDAEFSVNINESGLYTLAFEWIQVESKGLDIEIGIEINDELPYDAANSISFSRLWTNKEEISQDIFGNDIRPTQVEQAEWQKNVLRNSNGYITEPLQFYFESGNNKITIKTKDEPFVLKNIILTPLQMAKDYYSIDKNYKENGYKIADAKPIIIEGEKALYKSSATLHPFSDRSTPSTQPYEQGLMKINAIGGDNWAYSGDFLIWKFNVEADGLYTMSIKARQNITSGVVSGRRIYIDGNVPFAQAECVEVGYNPDWQSIVIEKDDEPCYFYFTKGPHELKIEVNLGEMGAVLEETTEILAELNKIYREIIVLTGTSPSIYRDYKLEQYIPETISNMEVQYKRLIQVIDDIVEISGEENSENVGTLRMVAKQLESMYNSPDKIPRKLSYFKSNIGSLGTWINNNRKQPLEIDYIAFVGNENTLPKTNAGFFEKLWFSVVNFFYSFIIDYSAIGNLSEIDKDNEITVWVSSGRDQMQILKSLVDDSFAPNHDVSVSLQLVDHGTLLSATMSGMGPDVAMNCSASEPVNYALRGAAYDLTRFKDFEDFKSGFNSELFVPFYIGEKCYAIPETQQCDVLFYRTDILREIGLQIPQTWEEVISAISVLNKNNMEFCLSGAVNIETFFAFLMQNDGKVYDPSGKFTLLDSDISVKCFKKWTNFYLNYSVAQEIDFVNRFRTGEVPLGIASFTTYNSLTVSAPEITGQWGFTLIPGTVKNDGTIDRTNQLSGTAIMMLADTKSPESSWKFMKWLMSTETQTRFANEMESILGVSARYNTANSEAFNRLPWTIKEITVLNTQLKSAKAIEEVPGGYYLSRHVFNAYREVVNHGGDAKDVLLDYVYTINSEISSKRKEFGLN